VRPTDLPTEAGPGGPVGSPSTNGPASIRLRQRVAWPDTDAAGIYHWTTIARFAEVAEAALHSALGILEETFGATPRVSVHFEFHNPLRFNDEAWVELAVAAVGRASLRYRLTVTDLAGAPVADGEIVCCLLDTQRSGPRPWPDHLRAALETSGRVAST